MISFRMNTSNSMEEMGKNQTIIDSPSSNSFGEMRSFGKVRSSPTPTVYVTPALPEINGDAVHSYSEEGTLKDSFGKKTHRKRTKVSSLSTCLLVE